MMITMKAITCKKGCLQLSIVEYARLHYAYDFKIEPKLIDWFSLFLVIDYAIYESTLFCI